MAVWNTIDDTYSNFVFYIVMKPSSKLAKIRCKASFLHNTKIGVPIIDSIPHCHTENALKRGKNQEMWLRYYIEDKVGVCIIDSIPHCFSKHLSMAVWNTIDDTYSNFVFYIVTKQHFLIFASFQSVFTMAVWNTIDDRYSNFCIMQKRSHISLFLPF